ncbi:chromatin modification-related protein EAF1 B isoform X2 [Neltuma alba]|uniref:chromatin modification-related protein EAF1 B isoform X2 n=1 Tax=Neltuma alba TaxID=207710 RepID=UPI0010A54215|nr:chromatin modification-related protein EAF1 B-like isoform X2 [Prosopis alba]
MIVPGMRGCNSGPTFLVNAEVDSMGGVVDCGVGKGLKTSPRQAAIEKARAELRQEYDAREERRRELEFLERGGNPLDFKFGNTASVSVQSTSLTDQHHEQFVTSEAKGSFALAASPHGDSVDSSARPVVPSISEPNTADNLSLFDRENELTESKKRSLHSNRRNYIAPSEQSSKIMGSRNPKESEDSAIFRPYARRNRSRPNHGPRGAARDGKGLTSETNSQKVHNSSSVSKPRPASSNGDLVVTKDLTSNIPLEHELDHVRTNQTDNGSISVLEENLKVTNNRRVKEDKSILLSQDDTAQNLVIMASREANVIEAREPAVSDNHEPPPFADTTKCQNEICSDQRNGFGNIKADRKSVLGMKNFNSELSCTQTCLGRDVNNDSDICTNIKNVDANGSDIKQAAEFEKLNSTLEAVKENNKANNGESNATVSYNNDAGRQNHCGAINMVKDEEDMHISSNDSCNSKDVQHGSNTISKSDKGSDVMVDRCCSIKDSSCGRHSGPMAVSISEPQTALEEKANADASDCGPCSSHLKLADKASEDFILEEARIIEAKRKRIAELSIQKLPAENHRVSHWGFVLEEVSWLANDFAQERLWKIAAAAQLCHRAAVTSQLRYGKQNKHRESKNLAHSMAKAVLQFWHSVAHPVGDDDPTHKDGGASVESGKETRKDLKGECPRKIVSLKLQAYALRFLKYNNSLGISSQPAAVKTAERIPDSSNVDRSWEELLTEENLFYTVPPMAIEAYRKSVESHFLQLERTGGGIQEVEMSFYDTAGDAGSEEIAYDEDEGETSTYYLHAQKKHRNMKSCAPGSCSQYNVGTQPSVIFGRRPASLNVGSVPTKRKRKRMASRKRVVSPFMVTRTIQVQTKTDASSGDTSSFQDDQSTLHGGSQFLKSLEVESVGDLEKQLPSDCVETSFKSKKAKNLVSAYDQRWLVDSVVLNEQRGLFKRRLDDHHFESNGSSGLYRQHNAKKPKITKQSFDNTFDNISPMTNSIPSPAASQMSNMSNLSKSIKIIRGRKAKTLKMSAGQSDPGGPWSLFEDQALVVLVHDMGPNWELISDAINSILQLKYIFRKPRECKERHKILMDKSAGDGADSAEDSGSSQSYPSTLPGIPKGSARQLFQRLQGPMEEETIKSHFEKIIKIGQKYRHHWNQNDNQDAKQIMTVDNSHVIALSKVSPNNRNGGLLTPLDLCDIADSLPLGYQGSHAGGFLSNQGSVPSVLPTSGVNPSLPASSGMVLGNSLSSPSGSAAASARYGVPRTSPLSVEEQQRIQQYNQMLSRRNVQQSSMSVPGSLSGSECGVRMLSGGNSVGMIGGMNRSMALSRPGFQGMASSSMVSSGSMLASNMTGMPSPGNMHSGVGSGQGSSMLRSHEALHMIRPGHNPEHQRQMVIPEIQMQVTQGNSQGISAFSGLSSSFSNQTIPPPAQPYPGQAQQPHQLSQQQSHLSSPHSNLQGPNHAATNSQQQAYMMRVAKERQLKKQRYLQQQQQQLAAASALMPHAQAQSQPSMSSSLQNNSLAQSQNSSQQATHFPVTPSHPLTPLSSHQQQKHHLAQGFTRNPGASGLNNQAVNQRQRQPQQQLQQHQQSGRQHPNQRQHPLSHQQAKLVKGMGRGSISVQQNIPIDSSHLHTLSVPPASQTADKGDKISHMMRDQNLHPASNLNPTQPSKPLGPAHPSNHSQLQHNLNSGPITTSSKQLQSVVSPSDNSTQGQAPTVPSGHVLSPPQTAVSSAVISSNNPQPQQQSQLQSKKMNQTQSNVHRMLQQNFRVRSESSSEPQSDLTQADHPPENNASQISTGTAVTHDCIDSSAQWRTEPPFDSHVPTPANRVGSFEKVPVRNSAGNEPQPTINQGQGPRQLSFVMPHVHNSAAQWQQRPLPIQQSSSQPIPSQQVHQPHEQHQQGQDQHSHKHVTLQRQPQ